jgi:hypothetical protein
MERRDRYQGGVEKIGTAPHLKVRRPLGGTIADKDFNPGAATYLMREHAISAAGSSPPQA